MNDYRYVEPVWSHIIVKGTRSSRKKEKREWMERKIIGFRPGVERRVGRKGADRNNRGKEKKFDDDERRKGKEKETFETEQQIERSEGMTMNDDELNEWGYRGYSKTIVYFSVIFRRCRVTVDNRTRFVSSRNSRETPPYPMKSRFGGKL